MPSSSMFISWRTYVFTLVFMFAYAVTGLRLLRSASRMTSRSSEDRGGFWTAYEYALLTVVLCTAFAVAGRWRLMDLVNDSYAEAREATFVPGVTAMCQAHDHVSTLASATVTMALFRAYRLTTYRAGRPSHVEQTLRASGGPAAAACACATIAAFGAWYGGGGDGTPGLVNAIVLGRGILGHDYGEETAMRSPFVIAVSVVLYLFFNAVVVSVITKQYVVSKMYSHGAPMGNGRRLRAVDSHPLFDLR